MINFRTCQIQLVGFGGSLVLRLLYSTLRWKRVGLDGSEQFWASSDPRIVAFWHGRQLLMPWMYLRARGKNGKLNPPKVRPMYVLSSQHRDGRMMACVLNWLGISSVYGSSNRGGKEALFSMIERVKCGCHIAMTPDGPKGPSQQLKPGIIRIAQRTGALIYPAAFSAQKKWVFGSWDGMILPKPFSKAILIVGKPVIIPERSSPEEFALQISDVEAALNDVTTRVDNFQY